MKKISLAAAFSLIELMISLVVISSITAAFAPVISKKLSSSQTSVSSRLGSMSINCTDKFGADCTLCNKTKCIACFKSCASNTYRDTATCTCINCSSISANCIMCDKGKCTQCNVGYKLVDGKCEQCPAGYSCNGISETICNAGTYSAAGAGSCTPCPAGQYQDSKGKSSCKACNAGKYSTGGASSCTPCEAGTSSAAGAGRCTPCSAGKYSAGGASSCTPCPAGKYQPNAGQDSCILCPIGQYQASTGKTSCTSCGTGKTTYNTGSTSLSNCVSCPLNCTNCIASACTACESGYVPNGSMCVSAFSGVEYTEAGTHTWTVQPGITKIKFTLIGGGNPGGLGISGEDLPAYTSDATIQLTGTYANLKGKTINVSLCGASGGNGGRGWYCQNTTGGYWLWGFGGTGGLGGSGSGTMNISPNATQIKITVGKIQAVPIHTGAYRKSGICDDPIYEGNGGSGGGASIVSDGTTEVIAGGGGGGAGGMMRRACSKGLFKYGLDGSHGLDDVYGGAGGTNYYEGIYCSGHCLNGSQSCMNGHNGQDGTTNLPNAFTRPSGYCGVGGGAANGNGYVKISWGNLSGQGGKSGGCITKTISVTAGKTCTLKVGGSGEKSTLNCGTGEIFDTSDTSGNAANGTSGGAGYGQNCGSGDYGKGGDGTSSTTNPNPGNNGYIKIENAS